MTLCIIRDYEVVEKKEVFLPEELKGIVKCANPKCITNNEPMKTYFHAVPGKEGVLRCHYCNKEGGFGSRQIGITLWAMKQDWKPGTMIYPLPALLVSCGSTPEDYNLFTVAWAGTICTNPAMCYISVRPERHSYALIKQNMEFVLNLTTEDMAYARIGAACVRGATTVNLREMKLTPGKARMVAAPIVEESPLSIECRVKEIVSLGSHDMFIAEVLNVKADERYLDEQSGKWSLDASHPLVYLHGAYYGLGRKIGKFGWAWRKRKNEIQLFKSQ